MRDPFANYDSWLTREYEQMQEDSDYFMEWAEIEDYDLEDPVKFKEAERAYEDYLEGRAEDSALALYEDHIDRMIDEAREREWDDIYY